MPTALFGEWAEVAYSWTFPRLTLSSCNVCIGNGTRVYLLLLLFWVAAVAMLEWVLFEIGARIEVPRILKTYAVLLKLLCPKFGVWLAVTAKLTNRNSFRAISLKKPFLLLNVAGTNGSWSNYSTILGDYYASCRSESLDLLFDFEFESSARVSCIILSSSASWVTRGSGLWVSVLLTFVLLRVFSPLLSSGEASVTSTWPLLLMLLVDLPWCSSFNTTIY